MHGNAYLMVHHGGRFLYLSPINSMVESAKRRYTSWNSTSVRTQASAQANEMNSKKHVLCLHEGPAVCEVLSILIHDTCYFDFDPDPHDPL